jgi:hypothetical protein
MVSLSPIHPVRRKAPRARTATKKAIEKAALLFSSTLSTDIFFIFPSRLVLFLSNLH